MPAKRTFKPAEIKLGSDGKLYYTLESGAVRPLTKEELDPSVFDGIDLEEVAQEVKDSLVPGVTEIGKSIGSAESYAEVQDIIQSRGLLRYFSAKPPTTLGTTLEIVTAGLNSPGQVKSSTGYIYQYNLGDESGGAEIGTGDPDAWILLQAPPGNSDPGALRYMAWYTSDGGGGGEPDGYLTHIDISTSLCKDFRVSGVVDQILSYDVNAPFCDATGMTACTDFVCPKDGCYVLGIEDLVALQSFTGAKLSNKELDFTNSTSLSDLEVGSYNLTKLIFDQSVITNDFRLRRTSENFVIDLDLPNASQVQISGCSEVTITNLPSNTFSISNTYIQELNVVGAGIEYVTASNAENLSSVILDDGTISLTLSNCPLITTSSFDPTKIAEEGSLSVRSCGLSGVLDLSSGNDLAYLNVSDNSLTGVLLPDNFGSVVKAAYYIGPNNVQGYNFYSNPLDASALNAIYSKLDPSPSAQNSYGSVFAVFIAHPSDVAGTRCPGYDSDDPSLAPVAWTIYGT